MLHCLEMQTQRPGYRVTLKYNDAADPKLLGTTYQPLRLRV